MWRKIFTNKFILNEAEYDSIEDPLNMHRTASNEAKLKYAKQYLQKRQI